jgi:hypothetical protein
MPTPIQPDIFKNTMVLPQQHASKACRELSLLNEEKKENQ